MTETQIIQLDNRQGYEVDIRAVKNEDNSYSISTINNPQGISDFTMPYVYTKLERLVSGGVETPIISIRNDSLDKIIRYGTFSIFTDGSKPVLFKIYKNATLTNPTWVAFGNGSVASYDDTATATTTNNPVGGLVMGKVASTRINLFTDDVFIKAEPNDILTFTALSTSNTTISLFQRHLEY